MLQSGSGKNDPLIPILPEARPGSKNEEEWYHAIRQERPFGNFCACHSWRERDRRVNQTGS